MNLDNSSPSIPLPQDIQNAIDQAKANILVSQAEHQNHLNAVQSLKLEIQDLTAEKTGLEDKVAKLTKEGNDTVILLGALRSEIHELKKNIYTLQQIEKDTRVSLAQEKEKITDERKVLDGEINIVAQQKADLAIRESKLSEQERAHQAKVQRLQEAIS